MMVIGQANCVVVVCSDNYHAHMARRAQHLRCRCERSERADNKLDNSDKSPSCEVAFNLHCGLPGVAAHSMIMEIGGPGAAASLLRRARAAGLPLRGSGPDNVWQIVAWVPQALLLRNKGRRET